MDDHAIRNLNALGRGTLTRGGGSHGGVQDVVDGVIDFDRLNPLGILGRRESRGDSLGPITVIMQWPVGPERRPTSPVRVRATDGIGRAKCAPDLLAPGGRLRRDLGCVVALSGLVEHAKHRSDFGQGTIRVARVITGA